MSDNALTKDALYDAVAAQKPYRTRVGEVREIVDATLDEIKKARKYGREIRLGKAFK